MKKALLIFDVDNTLVTSYGIYDEAYRLTSEKLLGKSFLMTIHPDGSDDTTFAKMSNPELLQERLEELEIDPSTVDEKEFFSCFDEFAAGVAGTANFQAFEGVQNFVKELSRNYHLLIVTSGSRNLQTTILRRAGLYEYFDIDSSYFLSDFKTKQEAVENLYRKFPDTEVVLHFGDAPNDMRAIIQADIPVLKYGIGVAIAEITDEQALYQAGAELVLKDFQITSGVEINDLLHSTDLF